MSPDWSPGETHSTSKTPFNFIIGQLGGAFPDGRARFTVLFWQRFMRLEDFEGAWRLLGEGLESAWRDFMRFFGHAGRVLGEFL